MKNPLRKKQGVDKNGRRYTRLVRSDTEGVTSVVNIPSPTLSVEQAQEEGVRLSDLLETTQSVFDNVPQQDRAKITVEQLDALFVVAQKFGVDPADSYGFRRHVLKKDVYPEWTERGHGTRILVEKRTDGTVYDARMYSINDYQSQEGTASYFRGQMELRETLGLEPLKSNELAYIAGAYWDRNWMHFLDGIPRDDKKKLREEYIADINQRPELIHDLLDELHENPRLKVRGDFVGFVDFAFYKDNQTERGDFVAEFEKALQNKKWGDLEKITQRASFNGSDTRSAILQHISKLRKEDAASKRAAKKETNS